MDIFGALAKVLTAGAEEAEGYIYNSDMMIQGRVLRKMADEAQRIADRREVK